MRDLHDFIFLVSSQLVIHFRPASCSISVCHLSLTQQACLLRQQNDHPAAAALNSASGCSSNDHADDVRSNPIAAAGVSWMVMVKVTRNQTQKSSVRKRRPDELFPRTSQQRDTELIHSFLCLSSVCFVCHTIPFILVIACCLLWLSALHLPAFAAVLLFRFLFFCCFLRCLLFASSRADCVFLPLPVSSFTPTTTIGVASTLCTVSPRTANRQPW